MKKSVIVLIGVIYILAVAVVSFFGLQIDTFNETIYVSKVEIINENIKIADDGSKYVVIHFEDDPNNPTSYQLEWRVYPDDATRKVVEFNYDRTRDFVEVNEFGTVIFNRKGSITVYITSTDGNEKSDSITVIAK